MYSIVEKIITSGLQMKSLHGRIAGLSMCKLKFEDKKWFNQWKKKKKTPNDIILHEWHIVWSWGNSLHIQAMLLSFWKSSYY